MIHRETGPFIKRRKLDRSSRWWTLDSISLTNVVVASVHLSCRWACRGQQLRLMEPCLIWQAVFHHTAHNHTPPRPSEAPMSSKRMKDGEMYSSSEQKIYHSVSYATKNFNSDTMTKEMRRNTISKGKQKLWLKKAWFNFITHLDSLIMKRQIWLNKTLYSPHKNKRNIKTDMINQTNLFSSA